MLGKKPWDWLPRVHLEEVELGPFLTESHVRADGEHACDLMVRVGVDGPVGEEDVGGFGRQQAAEVFDADLLNSVDPSI